MGDGTQKEVEEEVPEDEQSVENSVEESDEVAESSGEFDVSVLRRVQRTEIPEITHRHVYRNMISNSIEIQRVDDHSDEIVPQDEPITETEPEIQDTVPILDEPDLVDTEVRVIKRVIRRRIIVLPDGTQKEVEEEVPEDELSVEKSLEESDEIAEGSGEFDVSVLRRVQRAEIPEITHRHVYRNMISDSIEVERVDDVSDEIVPQDEPITETEPEIPDAVPIFDEPD